MMRFDDLISRFGQRFLCGRTFELILAPALADLQFDEDESRRVMNRLAVLRALAGSLRIELARQAGTFIVLSLVPAAYYFVLMTVCFDFGSNATGPAGLLSMATPLLLLSVAPATVCFWPERRAAGPSR